MIKMVCFIGSVLSIKVEVKIVNCRSKITDSTLFELRLVIQADVTRPG